jgi:putative two-component system response regulator
MSDSLANLTGKRVLIIEDDRFGMAIMSSILRRTGAVIFFERWAEDIKQRIAMLPQLDIVLLDLNLPNITGFEVYEILRSLPTMNDVPVVIVSASDDTAVVNQARTMGINGFIAKPIDSSRFAGYVSQALTGNPVWVRR